jgi:hypothetical protein
MGWPAPSQQTGRLPVLIPNERERGPMKIVMLGIDLARTFAVWQVSTRQER